MVQDMCVLIKGTKGGCRPDSSNLWELVRQTDKIVFMMIDRPSQ